MKKRISYLMLIVISIVGSRLIFGKDYHLNSNNLIQDNVYLYQIFDGKEVLSTYVDNEHFYYVTYSNERSYYQYNVIKYNFHLPSFNKLYNPITNIGNIATASIYNILYLKYILITMKSGSRPLCGEALPQVI